MLRQVESHSDYYHTEKEEEEGIFGTLAVCSNGDDFGQESRIQDRIRSERGKWNLLKMNFSVGVNIYSENVTWSCQSVYINVWTKGAYLILISLPLKPPKCGCEHRHLEYSTNFVGYGRVFVKANCGRRPWSWTCTNVSAEHI